MQFPFSSFVASAKKDQQHPQRATAVYLFSSFLVKNSNRWFIQSNSITNKKMRQTFVHTA
jgi:hypothetical protein